MNAAEKIAFGFCLLRCGVRETDRHLLFWRDFPFDDIIDGRSSETVLSRVFAFFRSRLQLVSAMRHPEKLLFTHLLPLFLFSAWTIITKFLGGCASLFSRPAMLAQNAWKMHSEWIIIMVKKKVKLALLCASGVERSSAKEKISRRINDYDYTHTHTYAVQYSLGSDYGS